MGARRNSRRPWEIECRSDSEPVWKRFSSTKYATQDTALEAILRFRRSGYYSHLDLRVRRKATP